MAVADNQKFVIDFIATTVSSAWRTCQRDSYCSNRCADL